MTADPTTPDLREKAVTTRPRNAAVLRDAVSVAAGSIRSTSSWLDHVTIRIDGVEHEVDRVFAEVDDESHGQVVIEASAKPIALTNDEVYDALGNANGADEVIVVIDGVEHVITQIELAASIALPGSAAGRPVITAVAR